MSRGAAAISERWTAIDGLRLHALAATRLAPPAAPIVVLVHGVGVASPYFVPTIEALAADFRVFAVDLPGFGRSGKPPRALDIGELADALAAWLGAEGIARPIVLGNSVGCQVVVDFAVRYPDRVERVILTGPTFDPRARSAWRQIGRWLRNAPYERASQLPISVRDYWRCGIRRIIATIRFALADRVEEKLPHVQAPTLVVRGGKDAIVPQGWAEEVARLLPRAELAVIPGAGHTVNYNAPRQLARLVRAFVDGRQEAPHSRIVASTASGRERRALRGRRVRYGAGIALILIASLVAALLHPARVVRWLAKKRPEVFYRLETDEPLVALTIDDSPHATVTPRILDTLAEYGAHATFFVIGDRVPGNEAILRRIVAEGHELGNHLMTNAPSIRLSAAEFAEHLRQMHELLAPYGPVRWFRPGSGWYSGRMLDQLRTHDYRCAMGSAYAYDCQIPSARFVGWQVRRHVRPGAVIVLHDGAGTGPQTVVVLRRALPELARRGYRVVTLSELAALDVARGFRAACRSSVMGGGSRRRRRRRGRRAP